MSNADVFGMAFHSMLVLVWVANMIRSLISFEIRKVIKEENITFFEIIWSLTIPMAFMMFSATVIFKTVQSLILQ